MVAIQPTMDMLVREEGRGVRQDPSTSSGVDDA